LSLVTIIDTNLQAIVSIPNPPKKTIQTVVIVALLATAFSIVLPIRINAIVSLTSFAICLTAEFLTKEFDFSFFKTLLFILVGTQSIILLVGLVQTTDMTQGYADVERFGYALLLPFLIYLCRRSGITVSQLLSAFTLGCVALLLYGSLYAVLFLSKEEGMKVWELGHVYFTDNLQMHPTYLSIYLILVIFFLLEIIRTKQTRLTPLPILGLGVAVISLIAFLFFLRSQTALLTFALLSVLYILIIFKKRAWLVTFSLAAIVFLVFLLDAKRVSTFFDTYGKNVSSALDNRFKVWNGAIEAIKNRPFFGSGTGSEYNVLNQAYLKIGFRDGFANSYNAHNQYLQYWVRNGLVELAVFLTLLFYCFKQSLKFSSYTFLMFNMLMSLSMLAESCLSLHRGIVFFYFFISAFIFLPYTKDSDTYSDANP
jgi:O-antigen ligase